MIDRLSLQSLRGLACLLLVFYHVLGATPSQGLMISDGIWRSLNDALVPLRMPLFALIAGALWTLENRRGWALVLDKFQRLWLPMLSVGTLFALVQAAVLGTSTEITQWGMLHFLPVAHFWFLASLFLIFLICALFPAKWQVNHASVLQQGGWLLAFISSSVVYVKGWGVPWLGIAGALYLAPFFVWGVGLAIWGNKWQKRHPNLRVFLLMSTCLMMVISLLGDWGLEDRRQLFVLLLSLLYATASWFSGLRIRWLVWLGNRSYAIFLFHVFFTAATRLTLHAWNISSTEFHLLIGMVFGISGPVIFAAFLARWPILAWFMLGQRTNNPSSDSCNTNQAFKRYKL
jgi:surface polysaccharide O-acyltransferase-like enzyme